MFSKTRCADGASAAQLLTPLPCTRGRGWEGRALSDEECAPHPTSPLSTGERGEEAYCAPYRIDPVFGLPALNPEKSAVGCDVGAAAKVLRGWKMYDAFAGAALLGAEALIRAGVIDAYRICPEFAGTAAGLAVLTALAENDCPP